MDYKSDAKRRKIPRPPRSISIYGTKCSEYIGSECPLPINVYQCPAPNKVPCPLKCVMIQRTKQFRLLPYY